MIEHINPLYTVAMICAVALILVILAGFALVDWQSIWTGINGKDEEEFNEEWMDYESWKKTK